jgi:membrane-bound ClpP family serine protease
MWIAAGLLFGLVILVSLAGFHTGPHTHALAGAIGVALAVWLVFLALDGRSAPVLWALLSADLVVSAGVGVTAWSVLTRHGTSAAPVSSLESTDGVAVTDLVPDGIVRVRGEQWSATSANGSAPAGSRVQVLRALGVRLEVWSEDAASVPVDGIFSLDRAGSQEQRT